MKERGALLYPNDFVGNFAQAEVIEERGDDDAQGNIGPDCGVDALRVGVDFDERGGEMENDEGERDEAQGLAVVQIFGEEGQKGDGQFGRSSR